MASATTVASEIETSWERKILVQNGTWEDIYKTFQKYWNAGEYETATSLEVNLNSLVLRYNTFNGIAVFDAVVPHIRSNNGWAYEEFIANPTNSVLKFEDPSVTISPGHIITFAYDSLGGRSTVDITYSPITIWIYGYVRKNCLI